MTSQQVTAFLKAPVNWRCFIAYLFILPFFLTVPFIQNLLEILFLENGSDLAIALLKTPQFFAACVGILLGLLSISGFGYMMAHQINVQQESPFDVTVPPLNPNQIARGIIGTIAWSVCSCAYLVFNIALLIALPYALIFLSHYLLTILNIILWIIMAPTLLFLFALMFINILVATFRFIKTFQITTPFQITKNYRFVAQHKDNALRALLVAFILSQIVNFILGNIATKLAYLTMHNTDSIYVIAVAVLIGGLCFVYITLLHMIILAKLTTWIEYKTTK